MRSLMKLTVFLTVSVLLTGTVGAAETSKEKSEILRKLDAIEADLVGVEEEININQGRYVRTIARPEGEHFEARYESAKFHYEEEDYATAAIIFNDLIEFENVKERPEYQEVQYLLGDCLFRNRNFALAVPHLMKTVAEDAPGERRQLAILKLVDCFVNLRQFENAQKYYEMLKGGGAGKDFSEIQFDYARALYNLGQWDRAFKVFSNVPDDGTYRWQAEYHLGTIKVQQARALIAQRKEEEAVSLLMEAMLMFDSLLARTPVSKEQRLIRELAILGGARIRVQLDLLDDAMSMYRRIDSRSPFFDQALYEIAWVLLKQEKMQEAENVIEVLLVTVPGSVFVPEAHLLKANILMRREEYSEAELQFKSIIDRYLGTVETLDLMVAQSKGQSSEKILQIQASKKGELSVTAMNWLKHRTSVDRAVRLQALIEEGYKDTQHSQRVMDALAVHLNQKNKANIFSNQREGREKGKDVEHRLTGLDRDLLDLTALVAGARDEKRLQKARENRKELEAKYAAVPKTEKERSKRRMNNLLRLDNLRRSADSLEKEIVNNMDPVIEDVRRRYLFWKNHPDASQEKLAAIEKELNDLRTQRNEAFKATRSSLEEVSKQREITKIGDQAESEDDKIRKDLEKAIEEEKRLFAALPAGGATGEMIDRLKEQRKRLDQAKDDNKKYLADLEALVAEQAAYLADRVGREAKILQEYYGDVVKYRELARELAAEVAFDNLLHVRNMFHEIVLRADVGNVDIAWEKRDRLRAKIDQLLNQRTQEQQVLDRAFATGH